MSIESYIATVLGSICAQCRLQNFTHKEGYPCYLRMLVHLGLLSKVCRVWGAVIMSMTQVVLVGDGVVAQPLDCQLEQPGLGPEAAGAPAASTAT